MRDVNITELRAHLPTYLRQVAEGEEIRVTQRGRVIARIVPDQSRRAQAREALARLRKTAWLGDVESPVTETWSVDE